MGLLGNPPNGMGGSFFFAPEPAKGITGFEGLALNVLRSLQFSYMMMKGFRSTTRALRDLDFFRDEGGMFRDGTTGGRCSSSRWRPVRKLGSGRGKVGRIETPGNCSSRLKAGRSLGGRKDRGGLRNGRGEARCTGDNPGTNSTRAEGGKIAKNGETVGNNSVCKGSESTQSGNGAPKGNVKGKGTRGTPGENGREVIPGGSCDSNFGDLNTTGDPTNSIVPTEGAANAPVLRDGSSAASGMAVGESRAPTDGAPLSKKSALSVARLGAVDRISNQLKPMKGFMISVKMATGVVSGVKTATGVIQKFQGPAGGVLMGFGAANGVVLGFETARMLVKAGKFSKDFVSVWKSTMIRTGMLGKVDIHAAASKYRIGQLLKGLKASDGALTLIKLAREFGSGLGGSLQGGLSNWDVVSKSYDASNSVLKVFEAVLGLKGGGVIGLVGKGFAALKGAVGGLGLSVKLVKAVVVSKEISIFLLKGLGVSKTAIEAFKASEDGKRIVKWLVFKKDPADEDLLTEASSASLKGRADARTFEILITCAQQPAADSQGTSPSLTYSLASLLWARFQAFDTGDPDEHGLTSVSRSPSYILSLSLPS